MGRRISISVVILASWISCLGWPFQGFTAQPADTTLYLIPGQGADHRLFSRLELPPGYRVVYLDFLMPEPNMSMETYAQRMATQVDTSGSFVLIGVSLGGMLASEMATFLSPVKTIIISSAKSRNELPGRYRFQRRVPIYRLVPAGMVKMGARILQPLVEPASRQERVFGQMLAGKDPDFLWLTVEMIINWERTSAPKGITHIHGTADQTLPIDHVQCGYVVAGGSHMMTLTKGAEISRLLREVLRE